MFSSFLKFLKKTVDYIVHQAYYVNTQEEIPMNETTSYTAIAAFDVDAQKGFTPICPDELPVPGGHKIVDALNLMAQYADVRVASKDSHSPKALWVVNTKEQMLKPTGLENADITWVSHCVPGTPGFELLDGLPRPIDYDFMVYKGVEVDLHPYGACYHDLGNTMSTGVIEFLRSKKVGTVLVGGLALEFCVATTATQLIEAGFKVILFTPACRVLNGESQLPALKAMADKGILIANNETELKAAIQG